MVIQLDLTRSRGEIRGSLMRLMDSFAGGVDAGFRRWNHRRGFD
jgi:hypothetical protein